MSGHARAYTELASFLAHDHDGIESAVERPQNATQINRLKQRTNDANAADTYIHTHMCIQAYTLSCMFTLEVCQGGKESDKANWSFVELKVHKIYLS